MRNLALVFVVTAGCSVSPPAETKPGCNPLIGDDCLTPFPSSFFEAADATSATGMRVAISTASLPVSSNNVTLKPDRMNARDGFSPATPFLVYFKAGVDATQLAPLDQLAATVTAAAPVQIIDYTTGDRVPVLAELDANAGAGDRQGLLIHPMTRLKPATRYVIALVGLRDAKGQALAPAPFVALRDSNPLSKSLAPVAARAEENFAALAKAGVARGKVTLAWDVVTASDATATSHLLAMRDTALSMLGAGTLGYTVTGVTDTPNDPHLLREILVDVQVPWYLEDMSGNSMMHFGSDGQPAVNGLGTASIVIHIPQCAKTATAPLPLVVFGHGLFGNAKDTLASAALEKAADDVCAVFIATDWIGLSSSDVSGIGNVLASDLNNVYIVTDRLQQAHVNAQVMTRMFLTKLKDDPALAVGGKAVSDGSQAYYFGISLGGIQGATFMGLQPDIVRGVLNVPGCEWTLLIYRSTDFNALKPLLAGLYPDPLDAQLVISFSQSDWDYTDPATFAPHIIADPLPGTPKKRILVQESIGDAQVSNIATRVLVRTMGLPGLELEQPVFGVTQMAAPLDSAYTQWDSHPTPLPPTGDKSLPDDNGAHDSVYKYAPAQQQVRAFLKPDGVVTDTCQGPCLFNQ